MSNHSITPATGREELNEYQKAMLEFPAGTTFRYLNRLDCIITGFNDIGAVSHAQKVWGYTYDYIGDDGLVHSGVIKTDVLRSLGADRQKKPTDELRK